MPDAEVNLKQAAAELGVHYMTAYRYVRQGRLLARREGTAWRVARADIEGFLVPSSGARSTPGVEADWAHRLESCLLAGDETAAWRVIEGALAAGHTPTYCYLEMVASALASIGEHWADGEASVADQHLATAVAVRLVSRLGARFRRSGRTRGTVVLGAPPGELHSLPIAIVSDLVRLSGYDALELGANVPAEAFVSAAARTPRLVCIGIGVTQPHLLDSVQDIVDAIRALDDAVPIVVGGLAVAYFEEVLLRGVSAVAHGGRDAIEIIESLALARSFRRVV